MTDRQAATAEYVKNTIVKMCKENASMREIATFLSKKGYPHSRSAVAGKISRYRARGLIPQGTSTVNVRPTTKSVKLDKKFIPDRMIKKENINAKRQKYNTKTLEDTTGLGILFLEAKSGQCRWIMDGLRDGQKLCCGEKVLRRSFCEKHYFMCYEAPIARRWRFNDVDRNTQDIAKVMYRRFLGIFG